MKKAITFLLLLLISFTAIGQELNKEAQALKNMKDGELYTEIKHRAQQEWGSNQRMVVYEVNKQCKALFEVYDYIEKYEKDSPEYDLLVNAFAEWPKDYNMILYEFEKQLKAYQAL